MLHLIYWLLRARLTISVAPIKCNLRTPWMYWRISTPQGFVFFFFSFWFGLILLWRLLDKSACHSEDTVSVLSGNTALNWCWGCSKVRTEEGKADVSCTLSGTSKWGPHYLECGWGQKLIRVRPCVWQEAPQLASWKPMKETLIAKDNACVL